MGAAHYDDLVRPIPSLGLLKAIWFNISILIKMNFLNLIGSFCRTLATRLSLHETQVYSPTKQYLSPAH